MTESRQLYILCDTNAAIRDSHLFRKKDGLLLVALLRAMKGKLVVPDVLRMEYVSQFTKTGDEALHEANVGLDKLSTLWGYDVREILPESQFGEAQALSALTHLEDIIHVVPMTPELKIAAADRSINGTRPTSKSDHGYKDCLIWESLLTLPAGSEVILLSRDKAAFFDNGQLAPSLKKEADEKGLLLTAYETTKAPSLRPVVDALKERIPEIADSLAGELPVSDHPVIEAFKRAEPVAPAMPGEAAEVASKAVTAEAGELDERIAAQMKPFALLDTKALGFISYMRQLGKERAVDLLVQSGVPTPAVARNALERLALAGLITDTGHNYLSIASPEADIAAQLVELEMIDLVGLGD